jgi:hypothetical protein
MLRTHCGWARRVPCAFAFFVLFACSAVRGAALSGISTSSPSFQSPASYSISGYVYVDSAQNGKMLPGEWGLPGVTINLTEYSPSDPSTVLNTFTATSGSGGYYDFTGLPTDALYTVTEVQPSNYRSTANSVGRFLSSTGAALTAPTGASGNPANGVLDPSNPFAISSIYLPSPTGPFAPGGNGIVYSAVGYNFGQFPLTLIGSGTGASKLSIASGTPISSGAAAPSGSLATTLTVVGGNNRFLAGPGAGVLSLTGGVMNSAAPGSSSIDWQIASASGGLSASPSSGAGLAPLSTSTFTAGVDGTTLNPGTQNATLVVSGQVSGAGTLVGSSTTSAVIDPVYSRGIDSVSPVNFGRIIQGGVGSSTFTVSSTGSHDTLTDLTMNVGSVTGTGFAESFAATNGSPVLFNGATTTSSALAVSATFGNSITGPVSDGVLFQGNAALFTAETLAAGTPALPSFVLPYTATVIEPRVLQTVAGGGTANAVQIPFTGGGLLLGTVVSVPTGYVVTSANANPDSDHTSTVVISGQTVNSVSTSGGTTQIGKVTASQTTINSGGPQSIALSIELDSYGPTSGSASLNVTTGEAASVQDNTAYAPLPVFYHVADVGCAATGGVDPSSGFGAKLYGLFTAGSHLSSRVVATGTSGSNSIATGFDGSTLSRTSLVNASNVTGTVGSDCDVIGGPTMTGSSMITMAWRGRNADENGSAFVAGNTGSTNWSTVLPPGVPALTSDIVEIGGMPGALSYAIQLSYDDRVNTFINGGTAAVQDAYVVKRVNATWVSAVSDNVTVGSQAQTAVALPLENVYDSSGNLVTEGFLEQEFALGYTMDDLVGSWGVDATNHESWAIVNNGGGDFAVVPEPSTFALLGAAAVGLLVYRIRRS